MKDLWTIYMYNDSQQHVTIQRLSDRHTPTYDTTAPRTSLSVNYIIIHNDIKKSIVRKAAQQCSAVQPTSAHNGPVTSESSRHERAIDTEPHDNTPTTIKLLVVVNLTRRLFYS